jgi:hypothetical protein
MKPLHAKLWGGVVILFLWGTSAQGLDPVSLESFRPGQSLYPVFLFDPESRCGATHRGIAHVPELP